MEYWKFLRDKVGSQQKIIIPGADGAIIYKGKILLVKNKSLREWFLPGGLQELDESIEQTVVREIREELGIKTTVSKLVSLYSDPKWTKTYANGDLLQTLSFLFLMDVAEDSLINIEIDQDELSDYGWFDLDKPPAEINNYSKQMCADLIVFTGETLLR